jgi:choline dehydrogenase-like flavoprotein
VHDGVLDELPRARCAGRRGVLVGRASPIATRSPPPELVAGVPPRVSRAFVEAAAVRCGVAINPDFNGAEQAGVGLYQYTVRDRQRWDTAIGFLDPVHGRANLTVITCSLVTGLVVDGDRVTGVRARFGSTERAIEGREIILAAGAIGSPHLMMLSGIGEPDELRAAGIEPRHALPGVGKHLQDHPDIYLVYTAIEGSGVRKLSMPRLLGWSVEYLLGRGGPLGASITQAGGFVRVRPDAALPDTQISCIPYGTPPPNLDRDHGLFTGHHVTLRASLIYPRSVGEIRLGSADPSAAPIIDPRYLSAPEDLEHLVATARLMREIAATAPLAGLLGAEVWPGPEHESAEALHAYVRRNVGSGFHPAGTCKMGVDRDAVVDPDLRVRGLRGLRVADASIMPRLIGGNTNAPTIMIAEKAADLIQT